MGFGPTERYHSVLNKNFEKSSLTCLKEDILQSHISPLFPLMLNIDPTNDCNSQCIFCPRAVSAKQHGTHYISKEFYKSLIDQIAPRKLFMLNLHKEGEPLLHGDLPWMIDYAHEQNAAEIIHLNTNGILLTSKTGLGIIKANIEDITVSIDAARAATYLKLKRVPFFSKVIDSVKHAIDYRDKIASQTLIRVKIMEFDAIHPDEIEEFQEHWKGIADQIQVTGLHSWGGGITGFQTTDPVAPKRFPCPLLWYILVVNADGTVSKCNYDWNRSGVIGDAKKISLADIWQSQAARAMRISHLQNNWSYNSVCTECVAWGAFADMAAHLATRNEFLA